MTHYRTYFQDNETEEVLMQFDEFLPIDFEYIRIEGATYHLESVEAFCESGEVSNMLSKTAWLKKFQ